MPPLLPAKPFKSYDQLLALLQVRGMLIENEARAKRKLAASKDDCIIWHREQSKEIPIWVAIETWDFGLLTKYYNMGSAPLAVVKAEVKGFGSSFRGIAPRFRGVKGPGAAHRRAASRARWMAQAAGTEAAGTEAAGASCLSADARLDMR